MLISLLFLQNRFLKNKDLINWVEKERKEKKKKKNQYLKKKKPKKQWW